VTLPFAVSVFPVSSTGPEKPGRARIPNNVTHHNKLDRGGHFDAWKQPYPFK